VIEKLLKPAEHAEKQLIELILSSEYCPGDLLPAERILAGKIGVTRPTLRETLQRLSKEGWVTIQHGKPTKVNDYLNHGGLGILNSLTKYGKALSSDMVSNLMEVRTAMFPDIAQKAVANKPLDILGFLKKSKALTDRSETYADYDWQLQMLMVKSTDNPVYNMIFNDFTPLYRLLGKNYFEQKETREASLLYYNKLINVIEQKDSDVKPVVEKIMVYSQKIWQELL
jgi:GntR family transcriptional regulator, negative regulator for fad regulon and positive regulator of fabA